jgi:hypothetical protein
VDTALTDLRISRDLGAKRSPLPSASFSLCSKLNALMFCPQCKAEYRSGFKHCPDCDVDLVEQLPQPNGGSDEDLPDENLREVWAGDDEGECNSIGDRLKEAGIAFKVNHPDLQFLKHRDSRFRIGVLPNNYDQASSLIDKATDEEEEQAAMELPAEDDVVTAPDLDHNDWDPHNWNPQDATVEVWSENGDETTWMIEASLRENNLYSRTDVLEDGSRKVFVMPDDEARAREIVHEIKDATPPQ